MNAPEKVYCTPTEGGFYLTTIKPEPPFAEGVEYIRKDVFIEKAVDYIANNMRCDGYTLQTKMKFIKGFKNYMKGE